METYFIVFPTLKKMIVYCIMINICQFKWHKFYFSGIVCYDKLEDMLKLVNSQVVRKDNKYVVQKYMGMWLDETCRIGMRMFEQKEVWYYG